MESIKTEKKKKKKTKKEKKPKDEETPSVINKKRKAVEDGNGAINQKTKKLKLAGKINDEQSAHKQDESRELQVKKMDKEEFQEKKKKKKSKKEKEGQEKMKEKKKPKIIEDETVSDSRDEKTGETIDKVKELSKKRANRTKLHSFTENEKSIVVDHTSNSWNNWEKAEFADDSQKQKFLRLLGGKKNNDGASTAGQSQKKGLFGSLVAAPEVESRFESVIDSHVAKKVNENLQKQFADGIKLRKQQQMGHKIGLGFTGL